MLIPLRVYSEYSLLKSSVRTKDYIDYCKQENIQYIGLANENSIFGALQWTLALKKQNIKPILGSVIKVGSGVVWAYCLNLDGYKELSNHISDNYLYNSIPNINTLNLKNCYLICDLSLKTEEIIELNKYHNNIVLGITRQKRYSGNENILLDISNSYNIPIIAAPIIYYKDKNMHTETDCLWCIKNKTLISEQDREMVFEDEYLKTQKEYDELFKDIPWALENAEILAKKCNFQLKTSPPMMPHINSEDPITLFEKKVKEGFQKRIKQNISKNTNFNQKMLEDYQNRLDYEISMIHNMNFEEYFLIVAEIVQWSKNNNIAVGPGRGSGAGSLVAYCLEITSIDPIKYTLMFERFLNPDRVSLPDFDIDFCQVNRYKVINFIKKRFGEENIAHIITFGSLQYRAALRDIGRVLQIPYSLVDDLCKKLPTPFQGVAPTLKELREKKISTELMNDDNKELFKIAENVEGLPRHSSMHAAGIVIGNSKLSNIAPLYKEANSDMPIIQFAMKDAEAVGLVKFDILGLTILSTLTKTLEFLKLKNITVDLENLNLEDQNVFKMIAEGKTNSVFQMDSFGFKNLMKEMKPTTFEDIIAAGALYRPGPMSDIPQFIACKNGQQPITYFYDELKPILKNTYGVPVYQEHVLEIAKSLAGYSLKEADLLRRAMGKKIHSEMEEHKQKFVNGLINICNSSKEKAEEFFDNLARFASYGFNKAHATCYGMITYQSAYLKYHYPLEYLCSAMIHEPNLDKCSEIIQEAIDMNVNVIPPDINISDMNFNIINESIYYGIGNIKGIGDAATHILQERDQNGPFKSVKDLIKRTNPNKKILEGLVSSGALDKLETNKNKQLDDTKKDNTFSISLFEDYIDNEKILDWSIETKAKEEFLSTGYIFTKEFFQMIPDSIKVFKSMFDINTSGTIFALGIKPLVNNTKDKKMYGYQFFEKNGLQKCLTNDFFDIKMSPVFIDIEKNINRYTIKQIYTLDDYFKRYKKIFINQPIYEQLESGTTSLYLESEENNTKFIQNIKITSEFIKKYKKQIIFLA